MQNKEFSISDKMIFYEEYFLQIAKQIFCHMKSPHINNTFSFINERTFVAKNKKWTRNVENFVASEYFRKQFALIVLVQIK